MIARATSFRAAFGCITQQTLTLLGAIGFILRPEAEHRTPFWWLMPRVFLAQVEGSDGRGRYALYAEEILNLIVSSLGEH